MYNFGNISTMFKGVNFNKILSGSSKTLNIAKKAIPLYRDIRPLLTRKTDIKEVKIIPETIEKVSNNRNIINDTLTFFQ